MKRFKNILSIADREDGLQAAFELRRHTKGGAGRDGNPRQSGCTRPDHSNMAEDVLRETQTAVLAVKPSSSVSPVVQ
jgi:hypothetical protein